MVGCVVRLVSANLVLYHQASTFSAVAVYATFLAGKPITTCNYSAREPGTDPGRQTQAEEYGNNIYTVLEMGVNLIPDQYGIVRIFRFISVF